MKRIERSILWTAISMLGAMNLVFLLSSSGRMAFAETAALLADVLGPAEAVKLTDGEKEVTLKAKDTRLAWGDDDFRQSYTVGFIEITRLLNPLLSAEALVEEQTAMKNEFEEKDQDYKSRLEGMRDELQGLDRESPEGQARMGEFRTLYEEYVAWGQDAMKRKNALDVQQWEKCYRELASAVDIVAERLGVDIVLRFIPTDKEFKATDAEQALTEIRLRAAVRYPKQLDITDEVMRELSIQETEN